MLEILQWMFGDFWHGVVFFFLTLSTFALIGEAISHVCLAIASIFSRTNAFHGQRIAELERKVEQMEAGK